MQDSNLGRVDWIRTSDPPARRRDALPGYSTGIKKALHYCRTLTLVGWTGFEPATPCTPYKCATGLRHHPRFWGCKCKEFLVIINKQI